MALMPRCTKVPTATCQCPTVPRRCCHAPQTFLPLLMALRSPEAAAEPPCPALHGRGGDGSRALCQALLPHHGASQLITPCLPSCHSSPGTASPSSLQQGPCHPLWAPLAGARIEAGLWHGVPGALGAWISVEWVTLPCPDLPSLLARARHSALSLSHSCQPHWCPNTALVSHRAQLAPAVGAGGPTHPLGAPLTPLVPVPAGLALLAWARWLCLWLPGCSAFPGR